MDREMSQEIEDLENRIGYKNAPIYNRRQILSEDDELFCHISTILDAPLHIFSLYDNLATAHWLTVGMKVYMERQDLNTLNSALQSRGIRGFKDTFHATSHSLKTDPRITARRPLKVFCYWAKADFGCEFKNQIELISYLQNLGFRINQTMISAFSNPYDIEEIHKEIGNGSDELPYDVEGIVMLKLHSLRYWRDKMDNVRIHLIIKGRVQGVFFRDSTRQVARSLGVTGWVKNRWDGTVEVVSEGPEDKVRELIKWCHKGPPAARVDGVDVKKEEFLGEFDSFDIVY